MLLRHVLLSLVAVLILGACSGKEDNSQNEGNTDQTTFEQPVNQTTVTTPNQVTTPTSTDATGANSAFHYVCPNNCEGSGGSAAGNCPVCGSAYVHNAAFHSQQQSTGSTPQQQTIDLNQMQTQQSGSSEPNANGEWHYVCSANCGGGAGSAGNCPKCGAALSHNQAFHN